MKKLLPVLCLLLLLGACGRTASRNSKGEFAYYYPRQEVSLGEQVLCQQPVALDPSGVSVERLLQDYFRAQPPEGAAPVLPAQWELQGAYLAGGTAHVSFSGSTVSAMKASLTYSCVTKTLLQHPSVRSVSITVPGGTAPIVLTEQDVLLEDTGMQPQEEQVVLYFPDTNLRYLVPETHAVDEEDAQNKPAFILRSLLERGEDACIPAGTELLSVDVENGICTVELSSQFEQNMEHSFTRERMAVYAIVNSLTELPQISTVDLWVAGAPLKALRFMDLSHGLARDESMIASAFGTDVLDVTLYPAVSDSGLLAPVPVLLDLRGQENTAKAVTNALLSLENRNGIKNCVPQGTKLLSARIENGSCVLDFTGEFLDGCANKAEEMMAVRSVIATLCALEEIGSVEILVEGLEPNYRNEELLGLRQPQDTWFTE